MKKIYMLIIVIFICSIKIFAADISNITAITEVFGDGQRLTGVILEYPVEIDEKKLSKDTFEVLDRTILNIYTNDISEKTKNPKNGKYIIIELDPKDKNSAIFTKELRKEFKEKKVSLIQKNKIYTTKNTVINPSKKVLTNNNSRDLIVEDFKQFEFKDSKTGLTLGYNLYIPKNYDKNKKYPLVLFMHDAGPTDLKETIVALIQGNGAIVFASPEEQAKHEAFVLAPKYNKPVVDDDGNVDPLLDTTLNLLDYLTKEYSIDTNRLYTTGQSMGGMMSIVMNFRQPDLFAASYLVACQWNPDVVSPMSKNNIWIIVSTGDTKAFPGMNAITDVLKKNGAKVAYASWKGTYTPEEFKLGVNDILKENANINYTTLEKGTVVPENVGNSKGGEHNYTWAIAYDIEGIRDWLFSQSKDKK
ncbi:prolyl oligopeptidase family serine peptidase [Fusobacterium sp. 1001295B_180824_G3]|uniref:alpha/beta hydrolase-fold protein n=1 Tax=Fusobacterium sp. 1001295B_180824_G3 TaxID=2787123 RepID=UPI00189C0A66|nr:prolyl oligopeptidase family serine peptidase [Fusobacterium sp. 1001295B_180824_G3]